MDARKGDGTGRKGGNPRRVGAQRIGVVEGSCEAYRTMAQDCEGEQPAVAPSAYAGGSRGNPLRWRHPRTLWREDPAGGESGRATIGGLCQAMGWTIGLGA